MKARIYKPSKTATQSGLGNTEQWVLEYEAVSERQPEPLMGWTASEDTLNQVCLKFTSLEEAKAFAERKGLQCSIRLPQERRVKPRNYGDNFRYVETEE
jgi:hypothetical protein